jgi:hypothetical protein
MSAYCQGIESSYPDQHSSPWKSLCDFLPQNKRKSRIRAFTRYIGRIIRWKGYSMLGNVFYRILMLMFYLVVMRMTGSIQKFLASGC